MPAADGEAAVPDERFASSTRRARALRVVRDVLADERGLRHLPKPELDEMARRIVRELAGRGVHV